MALGFMRRHRRWLYVFLWLVIAAFIILYIPAFEGVLTGSPGETLAKVGGLPITVGEFRRSYLQQRQLYERIYQGRLDAAALKRMGLEDQVFESLVAERLVQLEARRLGLAVSDEAVARTLATSPEFQVDGRYMGSGEIRRRLELQGVSVEEFEESLRSRLLRERLEALVTDGIGVNAEEAEQEFRRRTEQVKVEYVRVDEARFRPEVAVTDDEAKARFEAKREAYRIPEKRAISYLLLDQAALRSRVSATDGELELYYQDHRDEFKEEEQACASHILVKVASGPEAKEGHPEAEARRIAEGLLAQVRGGGDFAALARKSSEDQGSAPNGGDLGCFPRGRMVPEFENVAFSLDVGQTSDLVRSSFGYHIIRLSSRRDEQVPALAQVKERIRQIVVEQKVQDLANEKAGAINGALARGRTLEEAALAQGLTVQKRAPLARGEPPDPLSAAALVRAFELKVGEVEAEAFLVPRGAAFIALAEIQPSRLPDLPEVQDRVKADLAAEKARARAKALAERVKTEAVRFGLEKAAAAQGLVRKETPAPVGRGQSFGDLGTGALLDEAAFALPEKTLSDPVRVDAGYAILRVIEKKAFDPAAFEQQRASLVESLEQEKRRQLFEAYLRVARERFSVVKRPDAFKRATEQVS
jgi:peptidyl-prolyl cis-trans isomerase D